MAKERFLISSSLILLSIDNCHAPWQQFSNCAFVCHVTESDFSDSGLSETETLEEE